mmetsp:Transcript_17332/g.66052  ORF Transcript_17332/g.66052 Transcript_17332/m.66052 type:complete len:110 (-) Transcript_17332:265-594(-)
MADAFDEARRVPSFVVDGERLSDFRRALLVKEIGAQTRRRQRPGEPPKSAAQEETLPFDPQRPFDAELDKFPAEIRYSTHVSFKGFQGFSRLCKAFQHVFKYFDTTHCV